jgi:hypothetical protein
VKRLDYLVVLAASAAIYGAFYDSLDALIEQMREVAQYQKAHVELEIDAIAAQKKKLVMAEWAREITKLEEWKALLIINSPRKWAGSLEYLDPHFRPSVQP